MKKKSCAICSIADGRRVCQLKENALICPVCCAKNRNTLCEGCIFYAQAEKFKKDNSIMSKSTPFIMALEPEVDEKVDHALGMAEQGNLMSAEGILISLLKKHPQNAMVQYGMGVICIMKNKFQESILYFDKAIEINPYFVEAWYNKGSAHQKILEIQPMIKAYQKVIELGNRSEHYVIQAKNIVRDFEKQVRKNNNLSLDEFFAAMAIFNEAFAALSNLEWERAISGFKKVLLINPRHTPSYGNIGTCYGYLGNKQEALAHLDKALELDPEYEPAIINREAISLLAEGEKIPVERAANVDYYKDFTSKNESLIDKLFGR